MVKTIYIKLTRVSPKAGPFNIFDQFGNTIDIDVSRRRLIDGVGYIVDDSVAYIRLVSTGFCTYERVVPIIAMTEVEFFTTPVEIETTGCLWRHLTNPTIYNYFYGHINPYIIEYPFAYQYYDEIVRNVKDFTRVYRYFNSPFNEAPRETNRVELDNEWFNKAVVYNGQQSSGILELVVKPKNNLMSYLSYPRYNDDSKTITYTKSDSFYQYNTFWDVVKDKTQPLFVRSCENLSIDREVNQTNMDYGYRSFNKAPIRGKDTKIRHILDNKNDIHLVSRFIYSPAQISYK